VFVEPGATSVVVRADGHKEARRTVALAKGETKAIEITLETDPSAGAVVVPPGSGAGGNGGASGTEPAGGAGGNTADANGGVNVDSDGMSTKTVVVIAGSALTAIGLGVFIGFSVAKGAAKDDADALRDETSATFGEGRCPAGVPACEDLVDANARGRRAETWSTIGLVGAGVGIVAVTAGLLWPGESRGSSATGVRVGGYADRSNVSLSFGGTF
jgi:hypothetical protein